ncbi:DUF3549 family protein [Halomonas sp. DP8Y7-1]|uniref:DUF3549 family protein n=1 Tax=Halomonas sp. DP8Y7-1 TaxID=2859078 RepID=UPI001C97242C|nr:DUF3549 family protein [Halomonas sp. DP8Y7-1]MBY6030881.1 DUF3549 family protein [Halomonas sp. DP8Y7-1]
MQAIHSLHDFFRLTGADVHLYHMGRRVHPCSLDTLADFEAGDVPWPEPWQGKARLAMVFRLGDMQDPLIWFLALPLDEQGLLDAAQRDAFLERLLSTLGRSAEQLESSAEDEIDNLMKDNPLAFTPSLAFQAVLHARASAELERPASEHLEPVEAFFTGQAGHDWQALGLQGLADYVVRLSTDTERQLRHAIPQLHSEVLTSLCYCLEHVAIDEAVADSLRQRGEQAARDGDIETYCACIRAVGGGSRRVAADWFDQLLADRHACGPDALAAMAARGWQHLEDAERLPRFLERLAANEDADFMALARDLAQIPRLRLPVLMTLRQAPEGSATASRLAIVKGRQGH